MKRIYLLIIAIIIASSSFAQYFSTGSDPGNIKWEQINTENFQVIYPEDFESQAKRFAALLEVVYEQGYKTLGTAPKKISVVMHSRTNTSNGMVATAPSRMEIYPTPHQGMYAQEWLSQLAIHEYRHVVQVSKIQQELPKIVHMLLGDAGTALVMGAYLPFWFMEGDAVVTETALTPTGRGRNPSFLMENKAQLLEDGLVSYDKITMGSYRDYIPNRYAFGWWFVGGIRSEYGAEVWEDVLRNVAQKPFSISPVNKSLKKSTGLTKEELYQKLWSVYREEWQNEVDNLELTNYLKYPVNDLESYTNYLYTNHLADGSVVAVRKSRGDITRIVRVNQGREEIIDTPGTIVEGSFSARGNLLIWNETRPHIRWTHAARSVSVLYNTETNQKTVFHSEANLSSPAISPDGDKFLAVSVNQQGEYAIQVFDIKNGNLLQSVSIFENNYIFSPAWGASGEEVYFIGLGNEGKYLASVNLGSLEVNRLSGAVSYDFRNLSFHDGKLLFTSAQRGIDNIYELNLSTQETYQLTESKFGADYAHWNGGRLDYSDYSSKGYTLVSAKEEELRRQRVDISSPQAPNRLADALANQEQGVINFSELDTTSVSQSYKKLVHSVNIHSWAPAVNDITNYTITIPGISFQSQNKLGTVLSDFGYAYDLNERRGRTYLNYQYTGWFPTIKFGVSYGGRNLELVMLDYAGNLFSQKAQWDELKLSASIGVPLKFSSGKYSQSIQPSVGYSLSQALNLAANSLISISSYNALNYQLYLSNVLHQSELALQPKWGQALQFNFVNSLQNLDDYGSQMSIITNLYFPGLSKYDGIKIYGGYQWRDEQRISAYNDFVRMARGYSALSNKELYTIGVNYAFPICYPDWSLGKLAYIQRITGNLFYDQSNTMAEAIAESYPMQKISILNQYCSYGLELYSDIYALRLPAPIKIGFRSVYLPTTKSFFEEFILSVNVFGI